MAFQKGESGNITGKKPGTPNKKTVEHLNRAQSMLEAIENDTDIGTLIASLSPKEKAALYVNLLEFTQPRLARQENIGKDNGPRIVRVIHSLDPSYKLPAPAIQDADYVIIPKTTDKKPF